ncbi:MAG: ABC transporter permease [Acidobacteriaceae bacterium]|nr:ABC transporter permease [Acidobacteriaceae bacterium]MBV9938854.1 ABC transporter permease [Acidobacteriaceae bacterium]
MRLRSIVREAAAALTFNRQRSLLTMLSLAWGVTCFVILYSYGEGFGTALTTSFKAVGQDLVLMFGGQTSTQAGGMRSGRVIRLERDDVEAIRDTVPTVAAISPEVLMRRTPVTHGYRSQNMTIRGVLPLDYQKVRNMTVSSGRWLSAEDELQKERVAVLGAKAAEKLFGEAPPQGEKITIRGMQFQVVGMLKTKIQISNYNTPDNECVFISYGTMSLLRDVKYPEDIVWTPTNPMFRADAVKQTRATLARLHHFSPTDERAVEVIVFNEFMKQIDGMTAALRILLGLIGTMTLAIGGVGLANIMLVSVTQRTREIGVIKSLGATKRSILFQFLLEAMTIVTIGGILGVALGFAVTMGIGSLPLLGPLFKDTSGAGDIHLGISVFAVITSTVMLEIVGLISGLLPALRASRLDPIEALRYE